MQWRKQPFERPGAWYSKFKLFLQDDEEKVKETLITRLQQPIDLRPSTMKKFFKKTREKQERFMQQYIPERNQILGNDLAAAHFIVFRGGVVKFVGQSHWIKADEKLHFDLPDKFVSDMFLEAVDCANMELYYEGLDNIRRLKHLRFMSFKNVKPFDDWCLDRVSGSELDSLEILNLSGTNITHRGLQALYRVPSLRKLIVDDPNRDTNWSLTLAMLQDINPLLEIVEAPVKPNAIKE